MESTSTLTDSDKAWLLNLARQTLYWHLGEGTLPDPDRASLSSNVRRKLGCFVTLNERRTGLRGCIGIFERRLPLYRNVISRTVAAATQDSRFSRVRLNELKDIELEISVLTEPRDLQFSSPDDLLAKLRPEVDGVILRTRYGSSTYLPQVWEQLPDKKMFLSRLCHKHGAPMDEWQRNYKDLKVQIYQAIVFHEDDYGRQVVGTKGAVVGTKGAVVDGSAIPGAALPAERGVRLSAGTKLPPGLIVTPDSEIRDPDEP